MDQETYIPNSEISSSRNTPDVTNIRPKNGGWMVPVQEAADVTIDVTPADGIPAVPVTSVSIL